MTENIKKTLKFKNINDENNLSAGICGPDGCVIDWSKTKKEDK